MTPNLQYQVREPMPGVVYAPPADLKRYLDACMLQRQTMAQAFKASFARHKDRIAVRTKEGELTYSQLDDSTEKLAAAFIRLGLKPLDRVIFQIGNCPELLLCLVACFKAGLIPVCTLAAHRESEIGYLGNHAKARMHFVQGDDPRFDDVAFAERMQAVVSTMHYIVQGRGEKRGKASHLQELMASVSLEEARELVAGVVLDPFQVAVFQLSGGTTGVPKIIPRFHHEYIYNMRAVSDALGYQEDDCLFMPLPMMHNLNMVCMYGPFLLKGATTVITSTVSPEAIGNVFEKQAPTWAVLAGPILERLKPSIADGGFPLGHLRGVITVNNAAVLRKVLNAPVRHIFGMTEGVVMFTHEVDPQIVKDTMVGTPISTLDQVKLYKIGTEEEITEEGVEGECAFYGPYTIHGYYDAEERNAQAFTSAGMYRSGDLMLFRDIDGKRYFQFRGRTKDVVDRGGEKINCEEVELLVGRHPSIASVALVGMPDKLFGERVCAFVTVRPGQQAPGVTELGAYLKELGLAKFKWPDRVEVIAELPLTNAGKLSKPTLKDMITKKLLAEQSLAAESS